MMMFFAPLVALSSMMLFVDEPGAGVELPGTADGFAVFISSMTAPIANIFRRRRGRPRKFLAPSRAVTLTLPESVLEKLSSIHPDPSHAVVQLAERQAARNGRPPAELAVYGRRAVITIRPTPSLERRAGVELVPLPDGRALISFDQPTSISDLELMLHDALDDPDLTAADRKVFEAIAAILKDARNSADMTLQRRNIIVLESSPSSRVARTDRQPRKKEKGG